MWARRPPCRRAADETPIAHAARHADAPTPPEGPRWAAAARALGKVVNAWRARGGRAILSHCQIKNGECGVSASGSR